MPARCQSSYAVRSDELPAHSGGVRLSDMAKERAATGELAELAELAMVECGAEREPKSAQ